MVARTPPAAAKPKAATRKPAHKQAARKPRLPQRVRQALADFQRRALELFAGDILQIILYGSYARGEATPDSDVDVMVVVNWTDPKGESVYYHPRSNDTRVKILDELALDLSLQFGFTISAYPMTEKVFNTDNPLAGEAKRERQVLWQREGWKMADEEEEHPAKPRDPKTWLAMAEDKLGRAQKAFRAELYGETASIAYYAMFYAARAALLSKGLYLVKHRAAAEKFGELFVKTGLVEKSFSDRLKKAKEERERSDYEPFDPLSRDEAEKVLSNAEAFVAKIKELLKAKDQS